MVKQRTAWGRRGASIGEEWHLAASTVAGRGYGMSFWRPHGGGGGFVWWGAKEQVGYM